MHYQEPPPPPQAWPPCTNCGQPLQPGAQACAWCQAPAPQPYAQPVQAPPAAYAPPPQAPYAPAPLQPYAPVPPQLKNEALAVFLSFIFPGIGQFYAGNESRGLLFLGLAIGNVLLTMFFFLFTLGFSIFIGIPLGLGIWVWSMVDAYQEAQKYNARLRAQFGWRALSGHNRARCCTSTPTAPRSSSRRGIG